MTVSNLPTAPSTSDPATFESRADALIAALPTFVSEVNTTAAGMNAAAAGGVFSLGYTFSTTTTDADPGTATLRLDNATQNAATTIRADLVDLSGNDQTAAMALFDDSTSTIKGFIKLFKFSDPTKYLVFSVSALATPSGYRNITVACVAYSAASPFSNGDQIELEFTRTGDKGDTGPTGPGVSQTTGNFGTLPTVSSTGGGNSTTYTTQTAKSVVTGKAVIDNVALLINTASGGSGSIEIANALSNAPLSDVSCAIGYYPNNGLSSGYVWVTMLVLAGTTTGLLYGYNPGAGTYGRITNANFAVAGNGISYSAAYQIP